MWPKAGKEPRECWVVVDESYPQGCCDSCLASTAKCSYLHRARRSEASRYMRCKKERIEMQDKTQLLLDGAKGLRSLAEALELAAEVLRTQDLKNLLGQKNIQ